MVEMYHNGFSGTQIAQRLDIPCSTVYRRLRRNGVQLRQRFTYGHLRQKNLDTVTLSHILHEFDSLTKSRRQLAKNLHIDIKTLNRILLANGRDIHTPYPREGKYSPRWKNGRSYDGQGYVRARITNEIIQFVPLQIKSKYILEHRLVMAMHIGRPLQRYEQIHHINGQRDDNRIENLELRTTHAHGAGQRYRCLDCGSTRVSPTPL